ncbi:unnamed protein product [Didymodactylos carnosus]|uniref:Major facilitator superfamily (MFS) profile domain-containing protein n=1 Tax=Didymodactylos carnosus TaxID=1234261 RepID=A0A815WSR1_9BILA|nr:unnamed protein product [Didymodactylos carnosus]CAF4408910.1 unnamed protein product [Didymodactylos carnosus]
MIIGSLMNLGTWFRLLSLISPTNGYAWLVIGQIFPALSQPFFTSTCAMFSARWFSGNQRALATSITTMANPLGIAIGSLMPTFIVIDAQYKQFLILLLVQAGFITLATLLIVLFYKSSPPTPPSRSQKPAVTMSSSPTTVMSNIWKDCVKLLKNKQFLMLLFSFSIGLGLFSAITTLLEEIIRPCGYTTSDAGIFGAIIIVAGLIGAGIAGVLMDKTHSYRLILKILIVLAFCSGIYFLLILRPNMYYPLAVSFGLMGLFLLPLLPVVFECSIECTFPINEACSNGILMCSGNILGGIFIFILDALIKKHLKYTTIFTSSSIFIFCLFICTTIVLLFYNGPYLRREAEQQKLEFGQRTSTSISIIEDEQLNGII